MRGGGGAFKSPEFSMGHTLGTEKQKRTYGKNGKQRGSLQGPASVRVLVKKVREAREGNKIA